MTYRDSTILIVPGSMLVQKQRYQEIKRNARPRSVTLLTPPMSLLITKQKLHQAWVEVANFFRQQGKHVTSISTSQLG